MTGYRVGVDIGGTFTDVVLVAPDGSLRTKKVPSTADDYGRGIVDGLRALLAELGLGGSALEEVIHGTTVATNAILEYRGAKTALLTTRGFRDVLELRRVRAPELYNIRYKPPPPMVPRRLRLEVDERLAADGTVVRPLDVASVAAALDRVAAEGVQAVAISFLHSYKSSAHERRAAELVRERLPDAFLSLSVDVLPEIREYERTSTTVINAYVGPIVRAYLRSLLGRLREIDVSAPLRIMQSNGGVMTAEAAAEMPAQIVESGPAAGVIAGQRLAGRLGLENLITFDMGGTTAKASLVEHGRLTQTTEYEVGAGISLSSRLVKGGGHALKLPVIDIAEVGAGGGSIVWIDKGGALKVGPRSAGAAPGPACYGAGGDEPTVTDANVVLGYISPEELAGGAVRLAPQLAEHALRSKIAEPLGLDLLATAHGVYTVAVANMIRAVKAVSTYRGRDPRDFALLAFGGNGPVFAAEMARALGMGRVIVPPAAGLFSAFGLLEADLEQHFVQTFFSRIDEVDLEALNEACAGLEARARGNGYEAVDARLVVRRFADLRYSGQNYELTVPAPDGALGPSDVATLGRLFGEEHRQTYGHSADDEPIELVNLRLVARAERQPAAAPGPSPRVALTPHPRVALTPQPPSPKVGRGGEGGLRGRPGGGGRQQCARRAYFGPELGAIGTPVVGRDELSDVPRAGPLIVAEYDATTVVPPDCRARLDNQGNIVLEVGGRW